MYPVCSTVLVFALQWRNHQVNLIMDSETQWGHMTLMHRYNNCDLPGNSTMAARDTKRLGLTGVVGGNYWSTNIIEHKRKQVM